MTVEAFDLPEVFGPSSFSGPWRGCHVDQPTSYYDNGSRGEHWRGRLLSSLEWRTKAVNLSVDKDKGPHRHLRDFLRIEVMLECDRPQIRVCL